MADSDNATPRRDDTGDPRRSRERAVKILFQADVRQADAAVTLHALLDDPRAQALIDEADDLTDGTPLLPPIAHEPGVEVEWVRDDPATSRSSDAGGSESSRRRGDADRDVPLDGFTRSLVLGVYEHRAGIDELISRFARRWQISRMPVVDRTVLRMATYELLYEPTSPAVVIDEAVSLAKQLSTDDSGRYVNGVLESIRKHLRDAPAAPAAAEAAPSGQGAGDTSVTGAEAGSDDAEALAEATPDEDRGEGAADEARAEGAADEARAEGAADEARGEGAADEDQGEGAADEGESGSVDRVAGDTTDPEVSRNEA